MTLPKSLNWEEYQEAQVDYKEDITGGKAHRSYTGTIYLFETGHILLDETEDDHVVPPSQQMEILLDP